MSEGEPQGCLGAILSLFGINLDKPAQVGTELPYRQRDDFLSAAELSFYRVLAGAVGTRAAICCKVNLGDLFFVMNGEGKQGYRNKIDRKHVDFLLCDPLSMRPRCGVELDDSSHARQDRRERDELVDQVFAVSGLPLVRIQAKAAYSPASLLALVEQHLKETSVKKGLPPVAPGSPLPSCPKCGVPMVERVAKKGKNQGQKFFGCSNYPKCTQVTLGPSQEG